MFTVIMQRAVLLSMAVGAGLSMAGGSAYAQEKTVVIHGTATPGGGFPVYGDAFAATINSSFGFNQRRFTTGDLTWDDQYYNKKFDPDRKSVV